MELKTLTILLDFWIGKIVHFLVIMLELSPLRQESKFVEEKSFGIMAKYLKDAGWKIKDKMQIQ